MKIDLVEEDGLVFKTIRIFIGEHDRYEPKELIKEGLYKVITTIDNVNRTYYYRDGIETSKERIIQDERIKNLKR